MQKHWWGLLSVLHVLQPAFNIRFEVFTTAVYFQVMSFKSVSFTEKYLKWISIHLLPLTCPSGTLTDSITPGIECEMIKWVWGSYESISPIIWEIKMNTDVNTKWAAEKRFCILAPAQISHRGKVSWGARCSFGEEEEEKIAMRWERSSLTDFHAYIFKTSLFPRLNKLNRQTDLKGQHSFTLLYFLLYI